MNDIVTLSTNIFQKVHKFHVDSIFRLGMKKQNSIRAGGTGFLDPKTIHLPAGFALRAA